MEIDKTDFHFAHSHDDYDQLWDTDSDGKAKPNADYSSLMGRFWHVLPEPYPAQSGFSLGLVVMDLDVEHLFSDHDQFCSIQVVCALVLPEVGLEEIDRDGRALLRNNLSIVSRIENENALEELYVFHCALGKGLKLTACR